MEETKKINYKELLERRAKNAIISEPKRALQEVEEHVSFLMDELKACCFRKKFIMAKIKEKGESQ